MSPLPTHTVSEPGEDTERDRDTDVDPVARERHRPHHSCRQKDTQLNGATPTVTNIQALDLGRGRASTRRHERERELRERELERVREGERGKRER